MSAYLFRSSKHSPFAAFTSLAVVFASSAVAMSLPASAATSSADTTKAFCTQMQTSQAAISAVPATSAHRLASIAGEWSKIARFAPGTLKADVEAIATAYKTADTQSAVAQKTTLGAIVAQAKKITAFVSSSCTTATDGGPGGDAGNGGGDRAAQFTKLRECVTKKGGTLPDFGAGGGQRTPPANAQPAPKGQTPAPAAGQPAPGGGPFGGLDAKSQAAFDSCRSELGVGNGPGGLGGAARTNPAVQACLKKKGITLAATTPGQPAASIDTKTRTALDACRAELGLGNGPGQPGQAGQPNQGAARASTTTVKK